VGANLGYSKGGEFMRWLFLFAFLLVSACLYIPIIEPEPYSDDLLNSLEVGKTTKYEVKKTLGTKHLSRRDNSVWVYGEVIKAGYMIVVARGGGAGWIEDFQFLVLEFSNDILKSFELVEKKNGCSSSGICLDIGYMREEEERQYNDLSLVTSKGIDDKAAKELQGIRGFCSVFIYQEYPLGRIAIDDLKNILFSEKAYIHKLIKPPKFSVTAIHRLDWRGEDIVMETFECESGASPLFVKVSDKALRWGLNPTIEIVEPNVGRKSILKRRLILLP
jgi:hypothetical protein